MVTFSHTPADEKSWVPASKVVSFPLSSALFFQLLWGQSLLEPLLCCQPSFHQAGRASLCLINYAITLSHYSVAATFVLWHWGQHLLYSYMWLCWLMQISSGGTFPLALLGTGGKVVLAPGGMRGIALCNLLLSCWSTDLGQGQEGGPSSISATAAWGFGLCIF